MNPADWLTLIIPSHSQAELLRRCLAAIRQRGGEHLPIFVIDDGSNAAVISRVAEACPGVHVLRHERPVGFCAAVNVGLRKATTPYVQVLNDDTEVLADWWQAPLERLRAQPRTAAVAPLVLQWPGVRIDSAGDGYDGGGYAWKRGHGELPVGQWLWPREVDSAAGCGAFYRRDLLLELGGFPEAFVAYFDDVDVGCRLRRAGHEIWYEPNSRLLHHGSASYGRQPNPAVRRMQSRNEERLFWRNRRRGPSHMVRHALVLLGKALRRLRSGELATFMQGRLEAWRELAAFRP